MTDALPPANYDEAAVGAPALPPLSLDPAVAVAPPGPARDACRALWLQRFAGTLYGPLPPPPDALHWSRTPLPDRHAERLALMLASGGRSLAVDAALWLPADRGGPVPLLVGLDFIGPAGALFSAAFPLDPEAIVALPAWHGGEPGRLDETLRGTAASRWPVDMILDAGWGLLTSCYGSWTPDDAVDWRRHGSWPLLDLDAAPQPTGAISLWAWALQRLLDVAVQLPEVDASRLALVGHSRLGKAALWAAANDRRVAAVISNDSGCGGASLSARNFGETLTHMRARFPHWLLSAPADPPPLDQHQLLASIAPRGLYVASAAADLWADPCGEYLALQAAAPFWDIELPDAATAFQPGSGIAGGPLGWHLRPGGHDILPHDWSHFLPFLNGLAPRAATSL